MKHTSKFTFSILIVLLTFLANAQEKKKDSIPVKSERYGIRAGIDLYKSTRSFYDKDYKGIEFAGDYRLSKKYFLAAEFGNENQTTKDTYVDFTTKGSYIKVGFDYNGYENWTGMENIIGIGLRYGVSNFSQTLNGYSIYDRNPYFGPTENVPSGQEYNGLSAHWIEVVTGLKVEVLHNIYVGFSVRLKTLIANEKPTNFDNLYIPGFNKTYNGNFGFGFNYTVSYLLPIYKKKTAIPKTVKKK
jgi:hypothetical protein